VAKVRKITLKFLHDDHTRGLHGDAPFVTRLVCDGLVVWRTARGLANVHRELTQEKWNEVSETSAMRSHCGHACRPCWRKAPHPTPTSAAVRRQEQYAGRGVGQRRRGVNAQPGPPGEKAGVNAKAGAKGL